MEDYYKVKYLARRKRKFDNLFRQKPNLEKNPTFNYIRTRFQENADQQFSQFSSEHYERLKANVKYVQWCSGLNVQEFCAVFNLGHNIISRKENKYSHNIRHHTFLKIYSALLIYLPSIELFDIFTLDFRTAFPFLMDFRQTNRGKLGKSEGRPRKMK